MCLESDSCRYLEKAGNLFTFDDRKIITFYFLEEKKNKRTTHIGALIMTNNDLHYLSNKLPYTPENEIKQLEQFAFMLNNLIVDSEELVPDVAFLRKTDPLNWTF